MAREGVMPVENGGGKGSLRFCHASYETPAGKTIILLGLPHPAAHGDKGLPKNFPACALDDSPCRQFLKKLFRH